MSSASTSPTKRILAFDVGIKNLSFVEMEVYDSPTKLCISRWDILDISRTSEGYEISTKDFSSLSENLLNILKRNFDPMQYAVVLIENQPVLKNPIMKSLQIVLFTFFTFVRLQSPAYLCHIKFVNACCKLKPNKFITKEEIDAVKAGIPTMSTPYATRKKLSVALTLHALKTNAAIVNSTEWIPKFEVNRKKDDLADAFLMTLSTL